ncbi:Serine/Threonine Kinase and Pseudokinase [Abortiporus biennis]
MTSVSPSGPAPGLYRVHEDVYASLLSILSDLQRHLDKHSGNEVGLLIGVVNGSTSRASPHDLQSTHSQLEVNESNGRRIPHAFPRSRKRNKARGNANNPSQNRDISVSIVGLPGPSVSTYRGEQPLPEEMRVDHLDTLPEHLRRWISNILIDNKSELKLPVGLRKADAQRITDFLYEIQRMSSAEMMAKGIKDPNERKRFLLRMLIQVVKQHRTIPTSLCLKYVRLVDREKVDGGGFADVFKGTYAGQVVALKSMRYYQTMKEGNRKLSCHSLCLEALLWVNLHHKYVLPFLGIDWFVVWKKTPALVTPWMPCKNIRYQLDQPKGRALKGKRFMRVVNRWLHQTALGLDYLHGEGVVHGDLPGANILLTKDWNVQLADFGLSVIADAQSNECGSVRGGAVRWQAPEIVFPVPDMYGRESTRPTYACDIYSFACVCIELYTRKDPWHNLSSIAKVCISLKSKERPERSDSSILPQGVHYTDNLWSITEQCWKELNVNDNTDIRPSATQLVEFMKSLEFVQSSEV